MSELQPHSSPRPRVISHSQRAFSPVPEGNVKVLRRFNDVRVVMLAHNPLKRLPVYRPCGHRAKAL
jgi:hypothetical protein